MKRISFLALLFGVSVQAQNYSQYVNPFIGTGGHGHTFPGASAPFGMVQLSPDTRIDGSWDGCSGYHYSDNRIYGFSHTHLNGTGVSDYGDILLMPIMGEPSLDNKIYSSVFSHQNEKASAGFYSVKLDKHNIDVRLTTSTRVGFHEYTFNQSGLANVILDLNHRDKLLEGEIRVINEKTIEVFRRSEAWARNQYVFARIEFNVPMKITAIKANESQTEKQYRGTELALAFTKKVKKGEKLLVKVSLSPTGYNGAELNASEIKHWNFEQAKADVEKLWNKELSKIEVTSDDKDKLTIFYTALYHTMIQPNIAEDLDGKYRGRDNKIHTADTFDYYSVFSLWDTFRGAHPLYTLIDKKRTADYINTFLAQYEQGGRLPVWELASNETDCMIGYHSVSVIADAMVKGITGFDYEKAYQASKHSAMLDHLGLDAYKKNGFISIDDEHESVSKTVEYAYDDWCIAQMAQILGKQDDYVYFMKRSQNWKNLFDWDTKFIRPKKNGGWDKPFDPKEVNNNFTEGNAWQYTFFVPHDINGMIETYGGAEKFEVKLDEMFSSESKTTGREQVDITGLIGQYAHGNEPSHHAAYLYNYVNKHEKTKEKIHYILDEFYKNTPDGLIGNEDCGQMSAWYVLSSMGMYSVTPGKAEWAKTTPYFEKVKIDFENKEQLIITKKGMKGYLKEVLAKSENETFSPIITVPVFEAESKSFKERLEIKLNVQQGKIFYSFENGNFKEYSTPIEIEQTQTIFAYTEVKGQKSNVVTASFYKKPNNYSIEIQSKYDPQYHAGGAEALLDGIHGSENWRKGEWHGYYNQDFEAIVDLKTEQEISTINASFLQDTRAWIVMPKKVTFLVSNDNVTFEKIAEIQNTIAPKDYEIQIQKLSAEIKAKARYIKVTAVNFGKLPEWHEGYPFDGNSYIFIDEIGIEK